MYVLVVLFRFVFNHCRDSLYELFTIEIGSFRRRRCRLRSCSYNIVESLSLYRVIDSLWV